MTANANQFTSVVPALTGASFTSALPPRIPASHLRAFANALDRLGYDVRLLLAVVGLKRADLDDPDATVSVGIFNRVICAACEERRIPNFGARVAAVTPIGAFPLLDYLVVTTDTVGGALDQLVRYFHLVSAPVTLSVVRDKDAVRLLVQPGTDPFTSQYETALAVHHLRAETERRLRVSFVSLVGEPDDRRDLEQLLGCPVRAPSTWSGIEFSLDDMRLPLRRRDSVLHGVLQTHAASVAPRLPRRGADSTVDAVLAALSSRLGAPPPTLQALARQLSSAPRTLQRRLTAAGVSYQQLIDTTRKEAAERLLADATLAVGEIGYLLGFSEPSSFHRAFKRWHDVTPQEYRRQTLR